MKRLQLLAAASAVVTVATLVGCGFEQMGEAPREGTAAAVPADALVQFGQAMKSNHDTLIKPAAGEGFFAGIGAGEAVVSPSTELARKIIYNAQVKLVVEDFAGVPDHVLALVKQFDAYVASSSVAGSSGENRSARWTIRVPVARFDEFVGAAKGLGELISIGTTSRDVSEEYYDVEARIRNKTKEEERLLALLEERPGKLEDVIAIERELSRVREELERMQGRMRVLADLTALTTVELSIEEIRGYQPAESPTLATRSRRAFEGSLTTLAHAGESLLIGAVALAPWLPLGAVALCPAYLLVLRTRRKHGKSA